MTRIVIETIEPDQFDELRDQVATLLERLEEMATVTQAQLDALTARIDAAVAGLRADIQAIKDAHPDVDITALESSLSNLEGLDAENPPPEPPA